MGDRWATTVARRYGAGRASYGDTSQRRAHGLLRGLQGTQREDRDSHAGLTRVDAVCGEFGLLFGRRVTGLPVGRAVGELDAFQTPSDNRCFQSYGLRMRAPLRRPLNPSSSAKAPTLPNLPILGELETSVLEYLWDHAEVDVKDVHRDIGAGRGITVSTIQSTLERLHRKGLARREIDGTYR